MTERSESVERLSRALEHTLLRADASFEMIDGLCHEALTHGLRGVCVAPIHVARCRARLGRDALVVCVIGFPLGNHRPEVKAHECRLAVEDGADEVDMVMNLGAAKSGDFARVTDDIAAVVGAAAGRPVKVILESALLEAHEKERACHSAIDGGAAFVKTSTGFAATASTVEEVRALHRLCAGRAAVKASGGIRSAAHALSLLDAGAERIGTSSAVRIVTELRDPAILAPPKETESCR